jgi:hypothetical protein
MERSSSIKTIYHTKVEDELISKCRPSEGKLHRGEMSNHHQRVAIVVRDDKMFRNLQKEMRQNSRTGYGSNQLVQRLVKQGSTATMLSEVQVDNQKRSVKHTNRELSKTRRYENQNCQYAESSTSSQDRYRLHSYLQVSKTPPCD